MDPAFATTETPAAGIAADPGDAGEGEECADTATLAAAGEGEACADTAPLAAAAAGAGEAMSELTYAGMAALFRSPEAGCEFGCGACLALTRRLLAGFATMSTSIQVV